MRKINQRERSNGMKWCTYCKPERVHAVWRNTKLCIYKRNEKLCYACDEHKHLLIDGTAPDMRACVSKEEHYDDHMSEADYQTWGRLLYK